MSLKAGRFYEFGPFRLNAEERLLFRDGQRIDLAPKVLETLIVLVENHEHLVTKDDLIQKLWPDTFVEESNLTFNVSTLRRVLGDDRNNGNRFIETIPRRGYRFIAPVKVGAGLAPPATEVGSGSTGVPQGVPLPALGQTPEARQRLRYAITSATLTVAALIAYHLFQRVPAPVLRGSTALTNDNQPKSASRPLVTDGQRIYFEEETPEGPRIKAVSVGGGEAVGWPLLSGAPMDISSDRSSVLLGLDAARGSHAPLVEANPQSGAQQRVGKVFADAAAWPPNGQSIVYSVGCDLGLANRDGSNPRKLVTVDGSSTPCAGINHIRWSPNGRVIRFTVVNANDATSFIMEVGSDGQNPHRLLPDWKASHCSGNWTPDSRYFVFETPCRSDSPGNIWALAEREPWLRKPVPIQLTHDSRSYFASVPSADGKEIFVIGREQRGELQRWDANLREFVPYLGGISADWVTFSPDKQWIAYESYPERTAWRMRRDGSDRMQLTYSPLRVDGLFWSPDSKRLAFRGQKGPKGRFKIYIVATEGGEPEELLPGDDNEEGVPTWSGDGQQIAYGEVALYVGAGTGKEVIHICDLSTRQTTTLPGSQGLWTSRWSPGGRYIAAVTVDRHQRLKLYDTQTETRSDLGPDRVENPLWSHDGQYIYFSRIPNPGEGVFRVRVSDGRYERVAEFGNLRLIRDGWNGLADDDSPLVLLDQGIQEVYALDVNWP